MNTKWQLPLQRRREFPFKDAVLTEEALTAISYKIQHQINGKGQNQVTETVHVFWTRIASFICRSGITIQASSYLLGEAERSREDFGSQGDGAVVCFCIQLLFKRGGKEFQAWLKLQVAFLQAQVINWAGINARVCYKKCPRILIKAISQHIGEVTLNSETLLMRQSRLITDSPRAFIFLQLHLQKHCAVEVLCQVPALWRSVLANRGLCLGYGAMQRGSF